MCRIIVAPDKFKGTLSAISATEIIADAINKIIPDAEIEKMPLADGGEGTASILGTIRGWIPKTMPVSDALLRPAEATVWFDPDGKKALVDSSAVIGLGMIAPADRNPWRSSSKPLGDLVMSLIGNGVESVEIGIGGTATVDCGLGFLQALGVEFYGPDGKITRPIFAYDLPSILGVVIPGNLPREKITGISDVDVPLLDTEDYPSMLSFAPQKGIADDSLIVLQMGIEQIVERTVWKGFRPDHECRFGGAGGGLGFAIHGVLHSEVVSGADKMIDAYGIFTRNPSAVVTGEGCFDSQSLEGKVVGTLLRRCRENSVKCVVIAGTIAREVMAGDHGIELANELIYSTANFPPRGPLTKETAALRLSEATEYAFRKMTLPG